MAAGANVFGRDTSTAVANNVLQNATLNATPSPSDPLTLPSSALPMGYARLLYACYDVRKHETDPLRLGELQQCISFAERVYRDLLEEEPSVGTPGQTPATAGAQPMPAVAGPQMPDAGMQPQAQPSPQTTGAQMPQ